MRNRRHHTLAVMMVAVLLFLPRLAPAAGSPIPGPREPLPVPPNPGNNPWLNFPTHYGAGAQVARHGERAPDAMARIDRFLRLPDRERQAYALAVEQASLKRGESLFADARLGTNGLNCQSCHAGGGTAGGKVGVGDHEVEIPSLRGVAGRFPRFKPGNDRVITQTEMQNNCIVMFMNGKPLDANEREAADLTHYVSRFR